MTYNMNDNDNIVLACVRDEWPWVRSGLEAMLKKTGEETTLFPEDYYVLLVDGIASLYVNQQRTWFAIVQSRKDVLTNESLLCILASHTTEHRPGLVHRLYLPQLEELAVVNGLSALEMFSVRRGFERTGWTPVTTCYRRRVGHG